MSFAKKGSKKGAGRKRLQLENEEVKKLNELCALLPKSTSLGSIITPTTTSSSSSSSGDEDSTSSAPLSNFTTFTQLPLSAKTQGGLKSAGYTTLTEIQRVALPDGLAGRDVLGAAKTGSGKTLAFLIPVIERLYRARWTIHDGIGAIIISPTRELAYQIFEVLRKVGARHEISAGLAIGGKAVDEEKERISRMNILVCTPGRLLQHMDETPNFNCDNLQILVLDEADRILDLGFSKALDAILDFLPKSRQTLLFSATQTKSVRDLARLSLNSPEYAAVHEHAKHSTPQKLTQYYVVCTLPKKLDILYSFIRTHLSMKILVFMSSCKQVRFVFEAFRRLRPGIPLMALYGKQKQMKRMAIYNDFAKKSAAVMFATDIAARGLDFPSVHWVIQLDCPEDCATYIHRVGRTARFEKAGNALLLLLPSEKEGMISELEEHKVPLQNIEINPEKNTSIVKSLQSFCTQEPEIKYLAQKSFVSYMRSVFLQSNKKIFDVNALPAEEYALSLGLPGQPKIRFAKKSEKLHGPAIPENGKNKATEDEDDDDDDDESESENENENENEKEDEDDAPTSTSSKKVKTAIDRIRSRKNQDVLSDAWKKLREVEEEEEEDDVLVVRRKNHDLNELVAGSDDDDDDDAPEETSARDSNTPSNGIEHTASRAQKEKPLSKAKLAKKLANSNIKINTKVMFDDDGNTVDEAGNIVDVTAVKDLEEIESREPTVLTIEESKAKMKEADRLDLIAERRRVKEKHREKARKLKQRRKEENDEYGGLGVTLAPMGEDEFGNEDDEDDEDDEDEDDDNEYNHEDDDDNGSKSFRGKRGYDSESEEDDEDDDEDEDEDEDEDHRFSAKKGQQKSKHTSKKARSNGNDLEQLALSLLK